MEDNVITFKYIFIFYKIDLVSHLFLTKNKYIQYKDTKISILLLLYEIMKICCITFVY